MGTEKDETVATKNGRFLQQPLDFVSNSEINQKLTSAKSY